VVITDKLASYLDVRYGKDAEHRQGSPFAVDNTSTNLIERFHGTLKARTKVMRGLKNIETAKDFTDGWLVYYNYLRPHESLDTKTPAQFAAVNYPYANWADIARNHVPTKRVEILHVPRGTMRLPEHHIGRTPKVRYPRITPKTPRIPKSFPIGGIYASKSGGISRHHFRGSRRIG